MSFKTIIGQRRATAILSAQLKSGRIPHAYLFLGPEGVGRKRTALELAKILNCQTGEPGSPRLTACGHCISCTKISEANHPDVQLIDFAWQAQLDNKDAEKQKAIKIDTIRALQHETCLKPSEGTWKVFIIDPAEKITIDAANCLLKTLEEPPRWTMIILLARHKENLPATVVSRTQVVSFSPLSESDVAEFLRSRCGCDDRRAGEIAALAEGSLANALELVREKEDIPEPVWPRITGPGTAIADLLALSQRYAKNAGELIDELLAEARRDFRRDPRRSGAAARAILDARARLESSANAQMVLDTMLLQLYRLSRTTYNR